MMVPIQIKSSHPRATHACDQCRRRKTKCSGEQPVCASCNKRGSVCQWTPHKSTIDRGSQKPYDAGIRYQPRTHAPRVHELPHIAAPRPTYPSVSRQNPLTTWLIAGTLPALTSPCMVWAASAGLNARAQYNFQDFNDLQLTPTPPSSCPSLMSDVSSCGSVPPRDVRVMPTSASPLFSPMEEVPKPADNLEAFLHELYQCILSEWPSLPNEGLNRIELPAY